MTSLAANTDNCLANIDFLDAGRLKGLNPVTFGRQSEQCMSLADSARSTIIRLGDLNAAREILRKELHCCTLVESWLGAPVHERVAIDAYIIAVQREFKVETQKVIRLMMKGLESDTEIIFTALLLIVYRFEHPLDYSGLTNVCIDNKLLEQLSSISSQTRTIVSDADLVCASGLGLPMRSDSTDAAVKLYKNASEVVTSILHNAVLEDMEQRKILLRQEGIGFPPSHIAYVHGNQDAALALWNPFEKDILGRTLLHHVAYASDIQMLYRLLEQDRRAVEHAKADIFGFTPLAIAACCKSEQQFSCFSVLWQSGADRATLDFKDRSILALAARSGSIKIVSSILQEGNIARSPRHELLEAVQSDENIVIVQMLMIYYAKHPDCIDSSVLAEANRVALERGSSVLLQTLALSSIWYPELTNCKDPCSHDSIDSNNLEDWIYLHTEASPESLQTENSWSCEDMQNAMEISSPLSLVDSRSTFLRLMS